MVEDPAFVLVSDDEAQIIVDHESMDAAAPTTTGTHSRRAKRTRIETPSALPAPAKRSRRCGALDATLQTLFFLRCCLCKYEAYTNKPMQNHYKHKHGVTVLVQELEGPREFLETLLEERIPRETATGSEAEVVERDGNSNQTEASLALSRRRPSMKPRRHPLKPRQKRKKTFRLKKTPPKVRRPLQWGRRHLPRWSNYLKSGSFELRRFGRMTRQFANTFRLNVPNSKLYTRCLLCSVGEYSTSAMKRHYRKSHDVDFQGAPLPKDLNELEEKARQPSKRRFDCASCSVKFGSNAELVSHLASQHVPTAFMRYRCKCGERFVLHTDYQEHIRKGHGKHNG